MSSLKTQRIRPVVMRLKPDTPLPSQTDTSRNDLIDDLTQQLRTVFDAVPSHSGPVMVEDEAARDHAASRVVSSRKFVIEAHQPGRSLQHGTKGRDRAVLETMKVLLGVFGMEPASITVTEQ